MGGGDGSWCGGDGEKFSSMIFRSLFTLMVVVVLMLVVWMGENNSFV